MSDQENDRMLHSTIESLLEQYDSGPDAFDRAVAGLSREQLLTRPPADQQGSVGAWHALELVCHVVDMEGVFCDRLKRVLAEESPALANADENAWAARLAYDGRDLAEELAVFRSLRAQMTRILRQQPAEAWKRIGRHSVAGELTLEALLMKAVKHFDHHGGFLLKKRQALGF